MDAGGPHGPRTSALFDRPPGDASGPSDTFDPELPANDDGWPEGGPAADWGWFGEPPPSTPAA